MTHADLPDIFHRRESNVRSYCRSFPTVFQKAQGSLLWDTDGNRYVDFFCGAGSLSYGHNPKDAKMALLEYLQADGVTHSLDLATAAKQQFLETFESTILTPRKLPYKIQFVGPTGANAVEAALKLVRKNKRRQTVVAFSNAYHGLSGGALSVTGNSFYRDESYYQRGQVAFMPFEGYMGPSQDSLDYFERCLNDTGSGLDHPAAVILETIQAEGGVNVASIPWLRRLDALCRQHQMLLVVDDIQVGCGRAGSFFSFERAGLTPDVVLLSKAISGYGLPMSLVLLKPELDIWKPGEHTGTFRGNNLAFITATSTLDFWKKNAIQSSIQQRSTLLETALRAIIQDYPQLSATVRGSGLIYGLQVSPAELAAAITKKCFALGLIVELCGPQRATIKFLPALNIEIEHLQEGIAILRKSIEDVLVSQSADTGRPGAVAAHAEASA
jgi:diaminobutyrate-2-oxoglutarate transaminase